MTDLSEKFSSFLHTYLPLARFMELDVEDYNGKTLVLHAPLAPNINDKLTAFGGSLYNTCVLACWGMAYLKVQEAGIQCNQVVTQSNIEYKLPVDGDIRAICHAPDQSVITTFIDNYNNHGKAKIDLEARVEAGGKTAVSFQGTYAIFQ